MPLDREHVSAPSRIMVPWYTFASLWLGVCYTVDPDGRLALIPPFPFLPSAWWGVGFLLVGFVLLVAMVGGSYGPATFKAVSRGLYVDALSVFMVWMTAWSGGLVIGAITGEQTFTGWIYPATAAVAARATMLSLIRRDL